MIEVTPLSFFKIVLGFLIILGACYELFAPIASLSDTVYNLVGKFTMLFALMYWVLGVYHE